MTPILFPFTYLAPEMMARAARFFPHLTIYQPVGNRLPDDLQPWVNDGFLRIRVPVPDDDDTVVSAADEYQLWARQHQPGKDIRTLLPGAAQGTPFFDDSAPAQILAELRADPRDDARSSPRLFNARLFLCLAQQLDLHNQEIRRRLNRVEADSNALMDELKALDEPESFSGLATAGAPLEATFDFMLSERLAAWTQLFLADRVNDAILLTPSQSVLTDVIQSQDKARPLVRLNLDDGNESGQRRQLSLLAEIEDAARNSRRLTEAAAVDRTGPPDDLADLTIYLIPGAGLRPFLTELTGVADSDSVNRSSQGILVGFLNPGSSENHPV